MPGRFGDLGQRRQPQQVGQGGDLVRDRCRPFPPGVQDLRGPGDGEEQVPGVQLADGVREYARENQLAEWLVLGEAKA